MQTEIRACGAVRQRFPSTVRGASAILGLVGLVLGGLGCGSQIPSERSAVPPASWTLQQDAADRSATVRKVERLPNGVTVVRVPGVPGTLRAMLAVAAGPADDPAELPGMTELVVTMALEGTTGRDGGVRARAEGQGASIEVAADGGLAGWTLLGPADKAEGLLTLLGDALMQPSFPSTRIASVAARIREDIESRDNAIVMAAVAVASGVSLGRRGPLRLQAEGPQLGKLNRELVVRHWSSLLLPSRIALVVAGGGPAVETAVVTLKARLARLKKASKPKADKVAADCQPSRRSAHLVLNPGGSLDHVFTMLALPVPGRGAPDRRAVETALAALSTPTTGLFARKLGAERAFQAAPRIIDLGYGGGRGAAIALMRISGPRQVALGELVTVLQLLTDFGKSPPEGEFLKVARKQAAVARNIAAAGPVGSMVAAAEAALYRQKRATAGAAPWATVVTDVFDPSSWVVVGVGPVQMAALLERLGPVSAWNSVGRFVGGSKPPACKRRQAL